MKQSSKDHLYDIQIKRCCNLANYINDNCNISNKELTARWKEIFFLSTKLMRFNKEGRRLLWNKLSGGYWNHFRQTGIEKTWDRDRWLREFSTDLFYYSDRMSFNSLTKLHWTYRQIMWSKYNAEIYN